jgi:hypothetical protein
VGIIVQYSLQWGNQELDLYVGILPTSENCLAEKDRRSSQRSSQEERIIERKKKVAHSRTYAVVIEGIIFSTLL